MLMVVLTVWLLVLLLDTCVVCVVEAGRLTIAYPARVHHRRRLCRYCHYMGISHRDLKLENFIFESRDEDANIKLIDFGLSAKYGSSIRRMHTMVRSTRQPSSS